jgi:hypothetical protein
LANILGQPLSLGVLLIIGPAAIWLVLLYLLLHCMHILRLQEEGSAGLVGFPWIALYPDIISHSISCVSVAVLPVGLIAVLILQTFEGGSKWGIGAAILMGFLCAITGGYTYWTIRLIRKACISGAKKDKIRFQKTSN